MAGSVGSSRSASGREAPSAGRWQVLAGVAVFLLAAGGVTLLVSRQEGRLVDSWRRRLSALADGRRESVDAYLRERGVDAAILGAYPTVQDLLSPGAEAGLAPSRLKHVETVLETSREKERDLTTALLGPDGVERARAGPPLPEEAFALARGAGGGDFRCAVIRAGGTDLLVVAHEIAGSGGPSPLGWVVIVHPAEQSLWPILVRASPRATTVETVLVGREGDDLVFLSPLRHPPRSGRLRLPLAETEAVAKLGVEGREDFVDGVDYRGVPVLAAVRRLRTTGWALVVKVDRAEAFEPLLTDRGLGLGVLLAVAIAIVAIVRGSRTTERLRASEKLRKDEERHRIVLDSVRDAVVWVRPADGRILEANRAAEALSGYSRDELVRLTVRDLIPPEGAAGVLGRVLAAATSGGLSRGTFLGKDGRQVLVEASSKGVLLGGEEVLVVVARDVSENEAALRRIVLLNSLLKTVRTIDQVLVRERETPRIFEGICRAFVEQGGFVLAWIGVPEAMSDRILPTARAGSDQGYLDEISVRSSDIPLGRGPTGTAYRERRTIAIQDWESDPRIEPWRESARRRGFRSSAACPLLKGGEVVGVLTVYGSAPAVFVPEVVELIEEAADDVGFALDLVSLRERHAKAEEDLRESRERFVRFMDQLPAAAYLVRPDGSIEWANRYLEELVGAGPLRGRETAEVLSDGEAEGPAGDEGKAPAGGPATRVWHLGPPGGEKRLFRALEFPVPAADGSPLVGGVSIDVTEQVRAEEEVKRLNAELEERVASRTAELVAKSAELESFASSVSHDLRAPLRAIDGFSKILQEDHAAVLDADGLHVLTVIRENVLRMGRLIDDLLAFSRAGRHELRRGPVDMETLARSALDEVLPAAERERTDVRIGPLPEATGDAALLRQVWVNLLANAVKFSAGRERRRIEVTGERDAHGVVYSVTDNGIGFDMNYVHKLFAVFQRLHGREFEGTGIGLALAHRIVSRHGGSIRGASGPEGGAVFTFTLPHLEEDP